MESLISTFHIDYKLLIAQVINFALVFSILYFLIFKPIIKTMAERNLNIEKGLSDAKEAEDKLALADVEAKDVIVQAKKEANTLIENSLKEAEIKRLGMVNKAKSEIKTIIEEERVKINEEKEQMLKDIKTETIDLVILTAEKVLKEKLDENKDFKLVKSLLS